MESNRIEEIVQKVNKEAKRNCASHSNHALSTYVSNQTELSYRTVERAFELYIHGKSGIGEPIESTVNLLCEFLGYQNYSDFVNKTGDRKKKKRKWQLLITISIALGAVFFGTLLFNRTSKEVSSITKVGCMKWSKTHYEKVACDKRYGTEVEPIDPVKLASFKKVEVNLVTTFFNEDTGQPLIWYYKTKEGDLEYFTTEGRHPLTKKTLKEITPYIIDKYVQKYEFKPSSYVKD